MRILSACAIALLSATATAFSPSAINAQTSSVKLAMSESDNCEDRRSFVSKVRNMKQDLGGFDLIASTD